MIINDVTGICFIEKKIFFSDLSKNQNFCQQATTLVKLTSLPIKKLTA